MSLSLGIFTFINFWWVTLFMVLPWAIEKGENAPGEYVAAPKRIRWRRIFVATTILALIFTLTLALVIKSGIIPVHNMS